MSSSEGEYPMNALSTMRPVARPRLAHIADNLVIAVAASLPWSSSTTNVSIFLWLVALVPTLDLADVRREIATPAGGLPVALAILGALMTWADVSWAERLGGFDSFFKLLMIPLLLVQFRHSECGLWVMAGYLVSCTVLLVVSSIFVLRPQATFLFTSDFGVPVKNAATQSGAFVTCIFGLLSCHRKLSP
jgi:O-antigen ligase